MNWIEIDLKDESAQIPEIGKAVLIHQDGEYFVARYCGWKLTDAEQHTFTETMDNQKVWVTHWCEIIGP